MAKQTRIDDLRTNPSHRFTLGDLGRLADNIKDNGLIFPILVTPTGIVVDGWRRVEAVRLLGLATIPATTVRNLDEAVTLIRKGLEDNTERKPMCAEEWVRRGWLLETLSTQPIANKDTVASAFEVSRQTYRRASRVVEAAYNSKVPFDARQDAREALAQMNTNGHVSTAYKRIRQAPGTVHYHVDIPMGSVELQRKQLSNVLAEAKGMAYALSSMGPINPDLPKDEAAQWVGGFADVRRTIEKTINRLREHSREHQR